MHCNGLKNKMVLTQGLFLPLRRSRCLLTFSFWKCCCCTCFCVITKGLSWIWFICLAVLCVWIFAIIPATGGSGAATPTWEGSFGCYLQLLASRQTFFSVGEPACQRANLLCLAGQSRHSAKKGDGESSRVQAVNRQAATRRDLDQTWSSNPTSSGNKRRKIIQGTMVAVYRI